MKYTGSQITIKLLEKQGIDKIAGIPGGSILPLYDALMESDKIQHILARHEQGAAFMAQGITRSTGKPAVCFATSGPGATNLLTAIADAKMDSIPIIAITGQVPYAMIGTDAFQEVDIYGLTIPITKHNFLVRSVEELFDVIPEAFRVAQSGRPGPVLVDIPKNIQMQLYEFDEWPEPKASNVVEADTDLSDMDKFAEAINTAKKPMLYVGGGVINSDSSELVYTLAKKNNIPVTTTLMALGCLPNDEPLNLGMLGMHGARYTNFLMDEADLVIALGVRFDDRATGNASKFCPNAKIIHIEIDESEVNKIKNADLHLIGDTSEVLNSLLPLINEDTRLEWMDQIKKLKTQHPFVLPAAEDTFHPVNLIRYISSVVKEDTIIATDVGQHQMWTAQAYPFNKPRTLLTSGGAGTMGFGLPTAIGAALANPDKEVICISGDGSILMNIQELATLADLNLNLKVIILNNGHLGLVRQQQEMFYNKHFFASKFITSPDFATIAKGFNVEGCNLKNEADPIAKLTELLTKTGPCVINIPINPIENVVPIVPPGKANTEMIGGESIDE